LGGKGDKAEAKRMVAVFLDGIRKFGSKGEADPKAKEE
jgi:hypothetical protein